MEVCLRYHFVLPIPPKKVDKLIDSCYNEYVIKSSLYPLSIWQNKPNIFLISCTDTGQQKKENII